MTDPQPPSNWPDPGWQTPTSSGAPPGGQYPGSPPGGQVPGHPPAYEQPTYTPPPPGYPQPAAGYGQQPMYPPPRRTNAMAIAALVCSLAGLMVVVSAPVGAILGHVARKQIRETGEDGDGLAQAGIWIGWIVTGLWVCVCVGYLALIGIAIGTSNSGL